ncbi:MAG: hypothetical protein ACPHKR_11510, partial [bacterium]
MNLHTHPFIKRLKNRLGLAMFKMDFVKESWQRKYQAVQNDEVPWTPLVKPIEESRIVLVTTGGVHLKSDTPFDMSD